MMAGGSTATKAGGLNRMAVGRAAGVFAWTLAMLMLAGCGDAGDGTRDVAVVSDADPASGADHAGAGADPGRAAPDGLAPAGAGPDSSAGRAAPPTGDAAAAGAAPSEQMRPGEDLSAGPGAVVEVLPPGVQDSLDLVAGGDDLRDAVEVLPPGVQDSLDLVAGGDDLRDAVEVLPPGVQDSGSGPATEVIEILDPAEAAFGLAAALQEEVPVEEVERPGPAGAAAAGGDAGVPPVLGPQYTWQDGDRTHSARLVLDRVVLGDGTVVPRDDVAEGAGGAGAGGVQPVFQSESGEQMTLPGGVILVLDPEWDADAVAGFLSRNGIEPDRVSVLGYLPNGFVVETEPGFASLDLANALAGQAGVEIASPNWSREYTAQ